MTSESSAEAYGRVLRQGARCVELDCWDGSDGAPVVTHGRTVCTKIKLWDALLGIRDSAFATSPYPVILSIEDHCCAAQQAVMARMMEEAFGEMLLKQRPPGYEESTVLPSPEVLKHKIIVKHKYPRAKLARETSEAVSVAEEDIPEEELFQEHALVLREGEASPREAIVSLAGSNLEIQFASRAEEVPEGEQRKWRGHPSFTDTVEDGGEKMKVHKLTRDEAEDLFRHLQIPENGHFVIRKKTGDDSTLVASVLNDKLEVRHAEIQVDGEGALRMGSKRSFSSLEDLVMYHRSKPIVVKKKGEEEHCELLLLKQVPDRYHVYVQHWYIPHLLEVDVDRSGSFFAYFI